MPWLKSGGTKLQIRLAFYVYVLSRWYVFLSTRLPRISPSGDRQKDIVLLKSGEEEHLLYFLVKWK